MQNFLLKKPFLIAGPCSVETEEQLIDTAKQIAALNRVDALRAGIWKPRTRPGNFEGIGTKGLSWLVQARKETGLKIITEVATAKQVEDALHFELDYVWIGARSTVNPFCVQEIADALKGTTIPVFIKNPVNPDLELWLGAVERIANAGIDKIGLIHRGFSSYGAAEYRNPPLWHIVIEMKRRLPNIPILIDPSHICGSRENLFDVAQYACNLNYDGMIIESHRNPDLAWSDAKQQVTPARLAEIIDGLNWKKESEDSSEFQEKLRNHRQHIDQIDNELINLLGKRLQISKEIGKLKNDHQITILQSGRWHDVVDRLIKYGQTKGLSKDFLEKYLESIHLESIRIQNHE